MHSGNLVNVINSKRFTRRHVIIELYRLNMEKKRLVIHDIQGSCNKTESFFKTGNYEGQKTVRQCIQILKRREISIKNFKSTKASFKNEEFMVVSDLK